MKSLKYSLPQAALMCGVVIAAFASAKNPPNNNAHNSGLLRTAIEARFGRPDRVQQDGDTLLDYRIANGDTVRFVLSGQESVRIEHRLDFGRLLGQRVSFEGTYGGPGKEADYIKIDGGSYIHFDPRWKKIVKTQGTDGYGQRIVATGVVRFRKGSTSDDPTVASAPDLYYLEDGEVIRLDR